MSDYDLEIVLLDKTINFPITPVLDLKPNYAKLEAIHTGVQKTNNAILTLIIPPSGRYIRTFPLLMDENTKVNYMIQIQITQGANEGQIFRCEIGQPTAKSDKDLGEILEIPLVAQEFITKEHYDSFQDVLVAPQDHFINIVNNYNKTALGSVVIAFDTLADIDIPNKDVLKQNWLPLAPTKTGTLFEEVIERLAESPTAGGVLTDYYFDFIPDPFVLRQQDVFAEEFGLQDSGVDINPLTVGQVGAESGNTFNLDNLIYKNLVILKCDPNCGSLPRDHQVFSSRYLHALQRPVYDAGETYDTGDVVQVVVAGFPEQRFFTSLVDSNIGNSPTTSPGQWDEDFSIDPSNPAFFTATPYTSDLDNVEANLAGVPQLGYVGFMPDWNLTRFNFDREIPDDRFERVSVKLVDARANSPPATSTLWTGKRIICGVAGSNNGNMGGAFIGHRGQIAEAEIIEGVATPVWHFSDSPIDTGSGDTRQQDMVNMWATAEVLVWNGTIGGIGDWVAQWNLGVVGDPDRSAGSPWHPVKSFELVDGATGIPDQAIEATYNWKNVGIIPPFESTGPNGGAIENKASRGAWLSWLYPFPRVATGSGAIGNAYGLNKAFPFLDTFNLTRNSDGEIGWNRGDKAEDLGAISSISFKLRLGLFKSVDDSDLIDGFANEPMVFWAMDRNDRIFFQEFTQRYNFAWEQHTIPVGPRAPQSLYNSRIDELTSVFGHILPNFDFFLPEREFNGVLFDWRFLKGFGVFMKGSYEAQGLYTGAYDEWFKQLSQATEQTGHNILEFFTNLFEGNAQAPSTNAVTDHAKIAMDELHFDKELYTLSSKSVVTNGRVILERDESINDYDDGTAKAEAIDARKEFFPQFWFITARGDVRLKLGQKFTISGPRVPGGGSLELVCSQVKHRIDTDGYFMEIFGIKKFVLP